MPSVWFWLGKVVARTIRPWMQAKELAYLERPHCRWPSVRKTSWSAYHAVCGAPPVDAVDLHSTRVIAEILSSGQDRIMEPPLNPLFAILDLPSMFDGLAGDTSGVLLTCAAHQSYLWAGIAAAAAVADPQDQERFKQWVLEHTPPESQERFKQWLQEGMPPESK